MADLIDLIKIPHAYFVFRIGSLSTVDERLVVFTAKRVAVYLLVLSLLLSFFLVLRWRRKAFYLSVWTKRLWTSSEGVLGLSFIYFVAGTLELQGRGHDHTYIPYLNGNLLLCMLLLSDWRCTKRYTHVAYVVM